MAFPAAGQVYRANFNEGLIVTDLHFDADGKYMTFVDAGSNMPGMKAKETIEYTAVLIRPGVWMVHWQEKDKMTVVHIEDFENNIVYSNITAPNGDAYHLKGTFNKA